MIHFQVILRNNLCLLKKQTQLKPVQSKTGKTTIHPLSSNIQEKSTHSKKYTHLKPVYQKQARQGFIHFQVNFREKTLLTQTNTQLKPVQSKTGKTTNHPLSRNHQVKKTLLI